MARHRRPARTAVTAALVVACAAMVVLTFGLMTGRWQAAPVLTGSMSPGIEPGALIIASGGKVADLRVDDVIVFHAPTGSRPVTVHRVVQLEATDDGVLVTTKGDANEEVDPWGPFELTDQRVWTVTRVVPGLGSAILAVRNPTTQFIALVLLAVAAAWLFSEDRGRRTRHVRQVGSTPPPPPASTPVAVLHEAPSAQDAVGRVPIDRAATPTGVSVPAMARVDLDEQGQPIGLWFSLQPVTIDLTDAEPTISLIPASRPVPQAVAVPAGRSPQRHAATWLGRIGSMSVGGLVVVALMVGATAAQASFTDRVQDDMHIVTTSGSLEPPTQLTASVSFVLGACEVDLKWSKTVSASATGYELLRQPLEQAPVTDLGATGTYEPTGPFVVVGTIDGLETTTATDVLPDGAVQVNTGFRYALQSVRDGWTSRLSETVDVTSLGVCQTAPETELAPAPEPTPLAEPTVAPVPAPNVAPVPEPSPSPILEPVLEPALV